MKLSVSAHAFSKSAVEKIEGAGGSVTWLKPPHEPKAAPPQGGAPPRAEPALPPRSRPERAEAAAEAERGGRPTAEARA